MATQTPWGKAQHSKVITRGIIFYSTAGHGGIHVSAGKNKLIPAALRRDDGWYEEDCEADKVVMSFPALFTLEQVAGARKGVKTWFPHQYEAATGETVLIEESYTLQREKFERDTAGKYVVVSACGSTSWEPCPEGFVVVLATIGGKREFGFPGSIRKLIPSAEYAKRHPSLGFIIENPAQYPDYVKAQGA